MAVQSKQLVVLTVAMGVLLLKKRKPKKSRVIWVVKDRTCLWNSALSTTHFISDHDFIRTYRLSRSAMEFLAQHLFPSMARANTKFRSAVPDSLRILIGVDRLANGHTFYTLSRLYNVAESTSKKIVKEFVHAVVEFLAPVWIRMPTSAHELKALADSFASRRGLPNIIGAVDGSHIILKRPDGASLAFRNRKGFDSIVAQVLLSLQTAVLISVLTQVDSFRE